MVHFIDEQDIDEQDIDEEEYFELEYVFTWKHILWIIFITLIIILLLLILKKQKASNKHENDSKGEGFNKDTRTRSHVIGSQPALWEYDAGDIPLRNRFGRSIVGRKDGDDALIRKGQVYFYVPKASHRVYQEATQDPALYWDVKYRGVFSPSENPYRNKNLPLPFTRASEHSGAFEPGMVIEYDNDMTPPDISKFRRDKWYQKLYDRWKIAMVERDPTPAIVQWSLQGLK